MSAEQTTPLAEVRIGRATPREDDAISELQEFLGELAAQASALVGGAAALVYLSPSSARKGGPAAVHYSDAPELADLSGSLRSGSTLHRLEQIAKGAASAGQPITNETLAYQPRRGGLYEAEKPLPVVAVPLSAEGNVEGACAIVLAPSNARSLPASAQTAALTFARFEGYLWRQRALIEMRHRIKLREALELLDLAQEAPDTPAMGAILAHELARRFGCSRVSIGLIDRQDRLRLLAVSGSDNVDRRGEAVEVIEQAMEECADQDAEVLYPTPDDLNDPAQRRVVRAHQRLSEQAGPSAILSVPLRVQDGLVGIATLEREASDPFPTATLPLIRLIAEYIGPALWTRRMADRKLLAVARDRIHDLGVAIAGPRHTAKKVVAGLAAIALVISAIPFVPAKVSAGAEVYPVVARSVVPSYEGYLVAVNTKPGMKVSEGEVLARLDTTVTAQELTQFQAERARIAIERDAAAAERDSATERSRAARIEELDSAIQLRQWRLERAEIKAPISGTVSRGDLEPLVHASVNPSQVMFEVIASENLARARVDERSIRHVRLGQTGTMVLRSRPDESLNVEVTRINPLSEVRDAESVYTVELALVDPPAWVQPGLTGKARLLRTEGDRAERVSLLQMFLTPLIDEARLRLWW